MERDDQLAELLMRWDDAIAAGRPLTPEAVCNDTPDLKHEFTQLLRDLGKVDPVLENQVMLSGSGNEEIDAGRYLPLSFHAKGGLGLVYVAEDTELKRSVALKWMQHLPAMNERSRLQFIKEAEITGKLEHPGVAPVYGAGKDPRGRPFYAMRFIQGKTLADEIKIFHSEHKHEYQSGEFARLLRKFVAVCQTIAYAHARGVIHRDIKPGNVMIGPYGETLVVDWGLAKTYSLPNPDGTVDTGFSPVRVGIISPEDSLDGQVVGTAGYMPPEQALGETALVGPRSDIYALGSTLYVLLTGKSLYVGKNIAEILHDLKQRAPIINPDNEPIPKPLLAICQKAMAREPSDRYENALLIADDIDRWLADEPVTVHRDGIGTRTRRWVRNHRTMVAATAAMLLLGIVAMIVVIPLLTQKNKDLAREVGLKEQANIQLAAEILAKDEANAQLKQKNIELAAAYSETEKSFEGAIKSLNTMFAVMSGASGSGAEYRKSMIDSAVKPFEEMIVRYVQKHETIPRFRESVATSLIKIAEIQATREDRVAAIATFERAHKSFVTILEDDPKNRNARFGKAVCEQVFAEEDLQAERYTVARPKLERIRKEFEELANDPTPLKITSFTSEGSGEIYQDSPAVRLGKITLSMIYSFRIAEKLKATKTQPYTGDLKPEYRQWLITALDLLTQGRPIPRTAPAMTQELALRLEHVLLLDKGWSGNTTARWEQFSIRLDQLIKDHGYLPNVVNMQMMAKRRKASEALITGNRAEAIVLYEEIVTVCKRVVDTWAEYDPLGIRDGAMSTLILSTEAWFILLREELQALQSTTKPDPAKIKAIGSNLDTAGNLIVQCLKYLSTRPARGVTDTFDTVGVGLRCARILQDIGEPEAIREAIQIYEWTAAILKKQYDQKPEYAELDLLVEYSNCQVAIALAKNLLKAPDLQEEIALKKRVDSLIEKNPKHAGIHFVASKVELFPAIRALNNDDFETAIPLYLRVLEKLEVAEKLGYPPVEAEAERFAFQYTIAISHVLEGKKRFTLKPSDQDALKYVRKGIEQLNKIVEYIPVHAKTDEAKVRLGTVQVVARNDLEQAKKLEKEILGKK